ncbi:MAG: hypothetical protein ABGY71_12955 [bacterium]|nr:hypothetical protein [Planctomycetota bacterium]
MGSGKHAARPDASARPKTRMCPVMSKMSPMRWTWSRPPHPELGDGGIDGTGLGLYTVDPHIFLLGGTVRAASKLE